MLPQIVCSTPPSLPQAGRVSWVSPSSAHQSSGPTASPLAALETVVVLDNSLVLTFLVCTRHCPHRPRAWRDVDDDLFCGCSLQDLWVLTAHSEQLGWFLGFGFVFWSIKYVFCG